MAGEAANAHAYFWATLRHAEPVVETVDRATSCHSDWILVYDFISKYLWTSSGIIYGAMAESENSLL